MTLASCAHCGTRIVDHSTMQESEGKTYCCRNCAAMASGTRATPQGAKRCAHCESVIVDASTQVEHEGQTFCCNNCAAAMAEGATHRST